VIFNEVSRELLLRSRSSLRMGPLGGSLLRFAGCPTEATRSFILSPGLRSCAMARAANHVALSNFGFQGFATHVTLVTDCKELLSSLWNMIEVHFVGVESLAAIGAGATLNVTEIRQALRLTPLLGRSTRTTLVIGVRLTFSGAVAPGAACR
jgi:hypothetical protein